MGGRFEFDANTASIYRRNGVRTQRGSAVGGWTLPYTTRSGEIYTVSATVQTDLFHTANIDTGGGYRPTEDGVQSRVLPQLGVSWRYPLVRSNGAARLLVEPVTGVFAAPNLGDQRNLPNEDSLGITFDDTNLLRPNRFTGYDRMEGGVRTIYGLNAEYSNIWAQRFGAFLGQQYRYKTESAAPAGSGIDTRYSDFVGRLNASPHRWLSTAYRFQIDNASRELVRSVSSVSLGPTALRYTLSHARIDRALQPTAIASLNQLGQSLGVVFTENWRVQGRLIQALGNDSGILVAGATLFYEDDCFVWGIDLTRRNIGRAELPPDTAILFRIALRNLGEFSLRGL
jgi:LPS-assembly protein